MNSQRKKQKKQNKQYLIFINRQYLIFNILIKYLQPIIQEQNSQMENSDAKVQQSKFKCSANVVEDKLFLEINDNITYKGKMQSSPYYNIDELKTIFQRGEIEIISKTTSKMNIKLVGFLTIQLQSEQNLMMQQLKKKVQELEDKLQTSSKKVQELEDKPKTSNQWIEEDLDSKANFDLKYIYKIDSNSGWSLTSTGVSAATINFNYNATNYTTSATNRKANTTGWVVTKMMRQKCGFA